MKKILLLGGSYGQLPAIYEAKKRGLYTILCDYLPDNPGARLVDEFHLVSTTDMEAVLALAKEKHIDYVFAYASDPAALTAAFVAGNMGLPGSSYKGVELLSYKDKFRQFLRENGYNTPAFEVFDADNLPDIEKTCVPFPLVVKPVDSSDTKGVSIVTHKNQLKNAANEALRFSRSGKVIVEEFIDADTANFHGDGFVLDGNLIFCLLGDQLITSPATSLKPTGSIYPSFKSDELVSAAIRELTKMIKQSGYDYGGVNLEVRIDRNGDVYVMEIGPRNGGTLTPQAIAYATGFDMLGAVFNYFEGAEIVVPDGNISPVICYVVHAQKNGVLVDIDLAEELKPFLVEKQLNANPGERIKSYAESNSSLGIYIFRFNDQAQLQTVLPNIFYKINNGVKVI